MARPLLLAVEDDPEQLSLMRRELANRYGKAYRVASVATAREGLRLLADAVRWPWYSPTCTFRGRQGLTSSRRRAPCIWKQDAWL